MYPTAYGMQEPLSPESVPLLEATQHSPHWGRRTTSVYLWSR